MSEYEIKVLITASGHHIIAYVSMLDYKAIGIKEFKVGSPMSVKYRALDDGTISATFYKFCNLSDTDDFYLSRSWIVAMLDPTNEVKQSYLNTINPPTIEISNDCNLDTPE